MNELLQANIFRRFTEWKSIVYQGATTPKLLKFEATEGDKTQPFYLATIISKEEKTTWQSFQDLFDHTVKLAQASMKGLYGLDVVVADLRTGIQNFNTQDLSTLLINHSKNLAAPPKVLIRYGQLFCILHKRAPADWGKIEIKTHVEIVDPEKVKQENYFKKLIRETGAKTATSLIIHDLSEKPVWNLADSSSIIPPNIYYYQSAATKGIEHV